MVKDFAGLVLNRNLLRMLDGVSNGVNMSQMARSGVTFGTTSHLYVVARWLEDAGFIVTSRRGRVRVMKLTGSGVKLRELLTGLDILLSEKGW